MINKELRSILLLIVGLIHSVAKATLKGDAWNDFQRDAHFTREEIDSKTTKEE